MTIYFTKEFGFQNDEDGVVIHEGAKEVSESTFQDLFQKQGMGLVIVPDEDGWPIAVDPAPTPVHNWDGAAWVADDEELFNYLSMSAELTRKYLMKIAAENISPLQDAVDLDEATKDEIDCLKAWKLYRVELSRMDQEVGWPSNIQWPKAPS